MGNNGAVTRVSGLYRSPNTLSFNPEGALKEALNCVINFPGVIESRRGFKYIPYTFGDGTGTARGQVLMSYRGTLIIQYNGDSGGERLSHDTGIAWVDYAGNFAPPLSSLLRMKSAEAAQNFYFTTDAGVKVLDDPTAAPKAAGLPKGPPVAVVSSAKHFTAPNTSPVWTKNSLRLNGDPDANGAWLEADAQTAYVTCYGTRDANDSIKLGEPSEPFYLTNPADLALTVGAATSASGSTPTRVQIISPHQYRVGDRVTVTYSPADANFPNGTYSIIYALTGQFEYDDGHSVWPRTSANAGTITSGAKTAQVPVTLSPEATADMFVQTFRAKQSTGAGHRPNADFFLVNEKSLTSTELSAGFFEFTDDIPDDALRSGGYFNPNVGGEAPDGSPDNDNGRPPLCNDLTVFDGRLWGGNLTERQNYTITLIGAPGASGGIANFDTVTIAGQTYTGIGRDDSETSVLGALQFAVYFNVGSADDLIQRTSLSLATLINSNPSSPVNAYFRKLDSELLGHIFLEARTPDAAPFSVSVSRPSAWDPDLSTGAATSDADHATNGLWFSKQEEPEAVPRLNRLSIGPKNYEILRIKPLGERLFVFTNRGIYTVSNTYPYRIDLLSKTAILVAPDTLVDLDDALYCLTTQGFARITDSGPRIIGIPIEGDVKRLYGEGFATTKRLAVAVGYESYRKYVCSMPTEPSDTVNTHQFVYDVATKTWCEWDRPIGAMTVIPEDDFLYVVSTSEAKASKERKDYTSADYTDESRDVTLSAFSGKTLTLSSVTGIAVGDLVWQSELAQSLVTAVDATAGTVTVMDTAFWTAGLSVTVYSAIQNRVVFSEHFAGAPGWLKHWPAVTFHLRATAISTGAALFSTELGPSESTVLLNLGGWGNSAWGQFAWAQPNGPQNKRVTTGLNATRASYFGVGLEIREARGVWSCYGYTPEVELMSPRNGK